MTESNIAINQDLDQANFLTFQFYESERQIFKARDKIKVAEHAQKYRRVKRGPLVIPWDNAISPYAVEPMNTFLLPWVRKIILSWAPQTGKTSVALNCLCYCIDIDPGPAMYIMPDEKVAKRISRRQIIPMLRSTPRIAELLGRKADDVTTLLINFINGMDLMLAWASSAAALSSEAVRYMFYDEPGKYPEFSGKEADPFSLGDVRTNTYPYTSKQLFFSTPNEDGDPFDRLIKREAEEIRRYHIKCPFCDTLQTMDFERISWKGVNDHKKVMRKRLARYACLKCGMEMDDYQRDQAVSAGRWIAEKPVERPTCIAFAPLESWHSRDVSMSKAAAAYLKGQNDPALLKAFETQHKCRAYKEVVKTQTDKQLLRHKIDIPPGIVPAWALVLTSGIDVQKRGFWFVVRAWDGEKNSHLVMYGYMRHFEDVQNLVFDTKFVQEETGIKFEIWRAGMDTGGGEGEEEQLSRTEEIYDFIKKHGRRENREVIFALKGASRKQWYRVNPPKPIAKMPRSNRKIPGGLDLRTVDTHEMKKLLHWRLTRRIAEAKNEDGEILPVEKQHFTLHNETGMDYVNQFFAEQLRRNRRKRFQWTKIRNENHLLDAEVYAAACAEDCWFPNLVTHAGQKKEVLAKMQEAPRIKVKKDFLSSAIEQRNKLKTGAGKIAGGDWMGSIN